MSAEKKWFDRPMSRRDSISALALGCTTIFGITSCAETDPQKIRQNQIPIPPILVDTFVGKTEEVIGSRSIGSWTTYTPEVLLLGEHPTNPRADGLLAQRHGKWPLWHPDGDKFIYLRRSPDLKWVINEIGASNKVNPEIPINLPTLFNLRNLPKNREEYLAYAPVDSGNVTEAQYFLKLYSRGQRGLWRFDLDSSSLDFVFNVGQNPEDFCPDSPKISPDGTKMAYQLPDRINILPNDKSFMPFEPRVSGVAEVREKDLYTDQYRGKLDPNSFYWMPDSERLVFSSIESAKKRAVHITEVKSGKIDTIQFDQDISRFHDLSPDGTMLVTNRIKDNTSRMFILNLTTGDQKFLDTSFTLTEPANLVGPSESLPSNSSYFAECKWTKDNNNIVFGERDTVWIINKDTGQNRKVFNFKGFFSSYRFFSSLRVARH